MTTRVPRRRIAWIRLPAVLLLPWLACACQGSARRDRNDAALQAADNAPYQAEVEEGLGVAVAILVDTSGSMRDRVAGDPRRKSEAAQDALAAMLDATDAFIARRPDFPVKIGIYSFSSSVRRLRAILPYDRAALRSVIAGIPGPGGGTAIGDAMREARPDLYRAGVFRKYLLVVTDGENTNGARPEDVVRDIWEKSQGGVQTFFVAFDTSPEKFAFLKQAGGDVIGAGTGADLRTALDAIYQGKILAEAPGGEKEPGKK
jgi:nitric oxide reductase activation protein